MYRDQFGEFVCGYRGLKGLAKYHEYLVKRMLGLAPMTNTPAMVYLSPSKIVNIRSKAICCYCFCVPSCPQSDS